MAHPGSGEPWEWRTLGVVDRWTLGVADPGSSKSWEWRTLGVAGPGRGGPKPCMNHSCAAHDRSVLLPFETNMEVLKCLTRCYFRIKFALRGLARVGLSLVRVV